jgi:hypothetical protein
MNQQTADARDVGGLRRAQQRVPEQHLPQTLALMRPYPRPIGPGSSRALNGAPDPLLLSTARWLG